MQICHLLVLSYVCLQALYPKGAGEEDNINPDDLARQLRSEICALNESQAQSFYRAKRDEENRDYQFPNPDDYGGQGEAFDKYGDEDINWFIGGAMYRLNVLQPYFGQYLSDVTSDILTWCIYPLSTTINIYGCINSTHRWSTPEFKALGFLDILSLRNDTGLPYTQGDLILDLSHDPYLRLSTLNGALISCTVRIPDTNATTIGVYFRLNLQRSLESYVIRSSSQSEAYLIEGQEKKFTCESYIQSFDDAVVGFPWYRLQNGSFVLVDEPNPRIFKNGNYTGLLYQLKLRNEELFICEISFGQTSKFGQIFQFGHDTRFLTFVSPTVNDTGEFKCASSPDASSGHVLYINVVFTKLPAEQIHLTEGSSSLIICEMKTPSDSFVYWTYKQDNKEACQIPSLNETVANYKVTPCNNIAIVHTTEELIDDGYSVFHLELQIPEVSFDHHGVYSCNVEYPAGPQKVMHLIQQHSTVFVKQGKST